MLYRNCFRNLVCAAALLTAFSAGARVKPGVEVLRDGGFAMLEGLRVGLVTNPSGVDSRLNSTIDILAAADNVELVVGSKNDIFSKQQSHGILSEFFRKNRVNRFNVLHKGERDLSCFIIGTLETDYATYRVYVLTRKNENQNLIQQLRIEPSNE